MQAGSVKVSKLCKLEKLRSGLRVAKDKKNEFGAFFYRTAESILAAAKPIAADCGISLHLECAYIPADMLECTATALDVESGEVIATTTAFVRVPESKPKMDSCQIWGAATSYVRKYALCGLLLIGDDVDNDSLPVVDNTKAPCYTVESVWIAYKAKYGENAKRELLKACGGKNPRLLSEDELQKVGKMCHVAQ